MDLSCAVFLWICEQINVRRRLKTLDGGYAVRLPNSCHLTELLNYLFYKVIGTLKMRGGWRYVSATADLDKIYER